PSAAGVASVVDWPQLFQIGVFFAEAGAFVFGSGLAIVPFLYAGVVNEHHWLNERQFIDAVAVAMITPGPVVITVGFIGYLIAGLPGAVVAALGTFLPCYLFTIIPAPYFRKHGKKPAIVAFVDGCTAAAIGTIAGAVIVLGKRSITDFPTIAIMAVTLLLLWKVKKIPEPAIVALAGGGEPCDEEADRAGHPDHRDPQPPSARDAPGHVHALPGAWRRRQARRRRAQRARREQDAARGAGKGRRAAAGRPRHCGDRAHHRRERHQQQRRLRLQHPARRGDQGTRRDRTTRYGHGYGHELP